MSYRNGLDFEVAVKVPLTMGHFGGTFIVAMSHRDDTSCCNECYDEFFVSCVVSSLFRWRLVFAIALLVIA